MKWLIAVMAALVLVTQYRIWLSPHGAREVMQLSRAVDRQTAENLELADRVQQLAAEVRDLQQGSAALEERARAELGLIAGNETYFQVVPSGTTVAPTKPATPAPGAAALAAAR